MKGFSLLIFTLFLGAKVIAQQGSDIYLFNFKIDQNQFTLSNARNITNSPGYDNQPYFMPDGKSLLYSSDDGFGQTDIYRYFIQGQNERRLTFTPNSEYSPTVTPDGESYSCIILERDGNQYLWKYPIKGAIPQKVTSINNVGYHCWVNEDNLGLFVVGEPNTLKHLDLTNDEDNTITSAPGVTLTVAPDNGKMITYADLSDSHHWYIKEFNIETQESVTLIETIKKSQYYTWTPTGILLSGDGKRIYKFDPKQDEDWVELANLGDYGIKEFTRLAVSPKGDMLAVVVSE
jgi:DNA-binding beta-propeller fold protein YncE